MPRGAWAWAVSAHGGSSSDGPPVWHKARVHVGLSLAGHDPVGLSSEVVQLLDGLLDGVGLLERAVLVVEVEGGLRVFDRVVLVLHSIRHLLAQQVPREEAEREAARAWDPKKVDRVDDLWGCTVHGEAQA